MSFSFCDIDYVILTAGLILMKISLMDPHEKKTSKIILKRSVIKDIHMSVSVMSFIHILFFSKRELEISINGHLGYALLSFAFN